MSRYISNSEARKASERGQKPLERAARQGQGRKKPAHGDSKRKPLTRAQLKALHNQINQYTQVIQDHENPALSEFVKVFDGGERTFMGQSLGGHGAAVVPTDADNTDTDDDDNGPYYRVLENTIEFYTIL